MEITNNQINNITEEWRRFSGNPDIKVEHIKGVLYCFADELSCLRLAYRYRHTKNELTRCEFSVNLGTWFFALELNT